MAEQQQKDTQLNLLSWYHIHNVTSPSTFIKDPNDDLYKLLNKQCNCHNHTHTVDEDIWLHGYWGNDWADHYIPLIALKSHNLHS